MYLCNEKRNKRLMARFVQITSVHNDKVKFVAELQQKSSLRRETGLAVVEGRREITHCIESGYEIQSLFLCRPMMDGSSLDVLNQCDCPCYDVSPDVYARMAYRGSTEGVIAIVKQKLIALDDLSFNSSPLVVVVESVEKPGNLGAVLRSAEAAAVDAMIVCDPKTDLYNPNLIRSSIGGVFRVPCVACTSEQCIHFLKARGIQILTAQLQDSELYYNTDMKRPTAIVMGTESTGLTNVWRDAADAHIRIPMNGALDSLNVSISAAILIFEAVRQRNL